MHDREEQPSHCASHPVPQANTCFLQLSIVQGAGGVPMETGDIETRGCTRVWRGLNPPQCLVALVGKLQGCPERSANHAKNQFASGLEPSAVWLSLSKNVQSCAKLCCRGTGHYHSSFHSPAARSHFYKLPLCKNTWNIKATMEFGEMRAAPPGFRISWQSSHILCC